MLAILHLSDMHLKENRDDNPILDRVEIIVDRIKNQIVDCTDVLIIFSGDIGYSGKNEEYRLAKKFFDKLGKRIIAESKAWLRIIFVPGNHDCEFTPNSVRDVLLNQAKTGLLLFDNNVIDILCETQKEYFTFVSRMKHYQRKTKSIFQSKLYNQFEITIQGRKIKLHCFNSASFSNLREQPGSLLFPTSNFMDYLKPSEASISISILHHPLNWMSSQHHRELRNKLIEISDIVFTGHEHVNDDLIIERKGDSAKFIESGALQDNYANHNSQFGLLLIDTDSENLSTTYKNYNLNNTVYDEKESRVFEISKLKTKRNVLEIKEDYKEWLEEIGAPIAHPRKEEPYLDDFYVAPDVQVVLNPDDESPNNIINDEHNIEELFVENFCAVVGSESSGKTTFLKKAFIYKFRKDFIPIFLDGEKIKKHDYKSVYENYLKKAFKNQYSVIDKNFYSQISRDKIVILLDNFGACPLSEDSRIALIDNLKSNFGQLFVTARELIHFDPITTNNAFENFNIRKILELNHDHRKNIISKWHILGQSTAPSDLENIAHKNLISVRFINNILEKHFSEPYPIYILTLLQVQDANSKTLDHGSIGFYYEYLIKHSLQQSIKNKNQISLYETFLMDYCYFLFDERLKNINEIDFQTFLQDFINKKRVQLSFSDLKDDLLKAKIIRIHNQQVSLHQQYIYYYYASRAIDEKLNEEKVQKRVKNMINRIYIQEFEGIILFLSHLSNNKYILATLSEKCKSYFEEHEEATIDKDIISIDNLVENEYLPLLESSDEPTSLSSRKNYIEQNKKSTNSELDPDLDFDVISSLNKFVRAIKTFELMGNISKINFSWDYDKKVPLVQDTYSLGLRVLTAYYKMIEGGAEEIISHIKQVSTDKEIDSINLMKSMTKSFAFQITFTATYNIIKRLSDSLGHKQLRPIFQEISKTQNSNATKLTEFAIDLMQLGIYSEAEIKKYLSDSKGFNRPIARLILRNFVYEYTQLFKIDIKTRQRIHSDANIKIENQRRIQNTSKRLKK